MTIVKLSNQELEEKIFKLEKDLEILKLSKKTTVLNFSRYSTKTSNVGDLFAIIDKEGINKFISPTIEKLLGWKPEEISGLSVWGFVHPDDLVLAKKWFNILLNRPNSGGIIEVRYKCKSGKYIWTEITGKNLLPDPDINGVLVTFRNVTAKIEAKNTLLNALTRNKALLQANPDLMFVFDAECKIIDYQSKDETKELYRSPNDFLGKSVDAILPIELSRLTHEKVQAVLETGQEAYSTYQLEIQGAIQHYETRYVPCGGNEVLAIVRNITERLKAEENLKEKESQCKHLQDLFRNMTDIMPDMLWAKDLEGRYMFVNNSFCRELLNATDINEPIGKTDMFFATRERLAHPENPNWHTFGEICQNTDAIVLKSGTIGRFDEYGNIKGEFLFLDVIKTPLRNDTGEIIGVVGSGRNVTERKRGEQKLRESEANITAIIENSLESIWSIDNKYRIQYVNDVFAQSFFQSFGVHLKKGVNILTSLPLELQPLWKERYDRAFRNEHFVFSDKVDLRETSIYVEVAMNPIVLDGKVVGASFYGKDITERKLAEIQIQYQSDLRKLLIELSTNFINLPLEKIEGAIKNSLELIGKFVGADRAYIFKYNFKQQTCSNTYEWCESGITPFINELQEFPINGFADYVKFHKKGELVHFPDTNKIEPGIAKQTFEYQSIKSLITVPMISNFECIGFVGFDSVNKHHNYTQDEQQLLQVYAQMLVNVKERINKELNLIKAKEKAVESEHLKMAFLQNMSHEIRTPMNSIIGFLELLKDVDMTGPEKNYFVDIVNQSGQRLLSTINDIIEISKIEAGQAEVKYSVVNIPEVLQFQHHFFEPKSKEKGIQLILSDQIDQDCTFIKTDKYKLDGILTNLINNALKFTRQGSVEFGNYHNDNNLIFFVKDTGIGIPADRLEAIFNRFVQADLNNTRPYEGSGLGLAIAKAYAEMLHGKIWVESEVGKGSCFYLSLPCQIETPDQKIEFPIENPLNLLNKQYTILVSEDDEFSYKYFESVLLDEKITLLRASNGEETIRKVLKNPFISLILMDIKMPVIDGLEATREIRKFNKTIPIIAQSAYALAGDKEKAIEAGCDDYIPKPINRKELFRLINKYIKTDLVQ
jgi:PAS domain S-box-containing protein